MKKLLLSVMFILTIILMAGPASAGTIPVGSPVCPIGDWSQEFQENGQYGGEQYLFDQIYSVMVSDDSIGFMAPGMQNFSDTTWTSTGDAHSATSWGSAVELLGWNYTFIPASPTPTIFNIWTHLIDKDTGAQMWWGTKAVYNSGWSFQDLGSTADSPTSYVNPVPEPASLLLLGTGLIGLGTRVRRLRRS